MIFAAIIRLFPPQVWLIIAATFLAIGFAWVVYDAIGDSRERRLFNEIERANNDAIREAEEARQGRERAIVRNPSDGLRDDWTRDR